jgi:hypothetical protein
MENAEMPAGRQPSQLRFHLRAGDLAMVDRTGKQFTRLSSEAEMEFWQELTRLRNLLATNERNSHNVSSTKRNPQPAPRVKDLGSLGSTDEKNQRR